VTPLKSTRGKKPATVTTKTKTKVAETKPKKKTAKAVEKAAAPRAERPRRAIKKVEMVGDYKVYDPSASREAYKKGEIIQFPLVRNWLDKGKPVTAFGKIVNIQTFDDDIPYLEVSFEDAKKLNKLDLGKEIRKFILESRLT